MCFFLFTFTSDLWWFLLASPSSTDSSPIFCSFLFLFFIRFHLLHLSSPLFFIILSILCSPLYSLLTTFFTASDLVVEETPSLRGGCLSPWSQAPPPSKPDDEAQRRAGLIEPRWNSARDDFFCRFLDPLVSVFTGISTTTARHYHHWSPLYHSLSLTLVLWVWFFLLFCYSKVTDGDIGVGVERERREEMVINAEEAWRWRKQTSHCRSGGGGAAEEATRLSILCFRFSVIKPAIVALV